jgi:hypothetical protein
MAECNRQSGVTTYLQERKVNQATKKEEANSINLTLKMDAVWELIPDYMM